jgi:two-component system, chemotaxis family, CheB/CheR fusion protein
MAEIPDTSRNQAPAQEPGDDPDLAALLEFIRDSRGFDFSGYKRTSLTRRIRKRMQDVGVSEYRDYRDRLEINADEFDELFNTILINVTGFMRDPETWNYLQSHVLPKLLEHAGTEGDIRIWSAGCSTGEEAYSLAILCAETLGVETCVHRVKIYGTDVDMDALRVARAAVYTARSLEPLSEALREKYFEPAPGGFVFRPDLRRRVIFGRHDITRDAPISRLDLLVCRNTLMYFNVETQTQIIDRFHFALREDGVLFLGKAEMLLSDGERFGVTNMRQRIFRRRAGEVGMSVRPPSFRIDTLTGTEFRDANKRRSIRDLALDAAQHAMLGIDHDGTVTLVNSEARIQFGLSSHDVGRPFRDLEVSYRPTELRSLIERAHTEHRSIRVNTVEHRIGPDEVRYLDIVVHPLAGADGVALGTTVTFIDVTLTTRLQIEVKRGREDLETAYEELQSTNEELETTNEELQSSIEELETTNEELQSTNEELETTNEELQSGNEELETMNEEMRGRTGELDEVRTFLEGVLGSVAAGVVVLDKLLRVRSWNRGAEDLWGLRSEEVVGEQFFGLEFGLPFEPALRTAVQNCVDAGTRDSLRIDAVNRKGRRILCAIVCSPLDEQTSQGNQPDRGVVLLMEDTTSES